MHHHLLRYSEYIPVDRAGLVVGTGGNNIHEVERLTYTSIKVVGDSGSYGGENRKMFIQGSEETYKQAILLSMKHMKRCVGRLAVGRYKTIKFCSRELCEEDYRKGCRCYDICHQVISRLQGIYKIEDRKTGMQASL